MGGRHAHPRHIAILGAGVSGLVCAYRLARAGHRVTVLETQDRIGGRALTLREPFSEGLVAQAGPARFPGDFARVRRYARLFDLALVPFYPDFGTVVACHGGNRIANYEPSAEEFWGYTSLVKRYPGRAERISLRLALRARAGVRRLLGRPPWMTYRFRDGTDALTDALAAATPATFRLNATVDAIARHAEGVRIEFTTAGAPEAVDADYAVCTIPLSVLDRIRIHPALSAEKARLVTEVRYSSAVRTFLEMRRPYWRDDGHNGFAVTDTLGEVWAPHFERPDGPALLVCYATGDLADRIAAHAEPERIEYALAELERIFPGARAHVVRTASFSWREQPWIRGGWPQLRNVLAGRVGAFRRPEGRLYFAGDYVATPWALNSVEGAIRSGERAAAAIARRPPQPAGDPSNALTGPSAGTS